MTEEFPSKFSTPQQSPGFLLWQVTNRWQRLQRDALVQLDLTHVQFVLLAGIVWLEAKGEELSQVKLAEHAQTDIMMTSQVVRALEKKELITRSQHPRDTRALLLQSTKKGRKLIAEALPVVEQVDQEFFSKLVGGEDDFCKQLLALLTEDTPEDTP